ncbi:LLM class F420-dependent oxidoreductase [soil metagenome]
MSLLPERNPWVEEYQSRVGFALQTFALPGDPEPGKKVIRAGILADELALDGFFTGDHPGYATEPWLHLTAVATQTRQIRLGSIVNCASYRHPVMMARLAADFDRISDGRLVLGLGIGWNIEEYAQLGISFTAVRARQEALEEYIAIINGVWGADPFTYHGKHWRTEGGHVVPGPLQWPRPPLIIAGAGERVTLRQVAQLADACNFGPGRNTGAARSGEDIQHKLQVLRNHCGQLGRNYDDILRSHYTSWLMIAETEHEAKAKLDRYYPDGLDEEQKATRIVGTPDQVAAYYQEIVDAGMQYFVCQVLDAGDEETIRLLATEVAPRIRKC